MVEQYDIVWIILYAESLFLTALYNCVQAWLVPCYSQQQRNIILMNQEGESGSPLLRDMISTIPAYSMISFYADKNLPRGQIHH